MVESRSWVDRLGNGFFLDLQRKRQTDLAWSAGFWFGVATSGGDIQSPRPPSIWGGGRGGRVVITLGKKGDRQTDKICPASLACLYLPVSSRSLALHCCCGAHWHALRHPPAHLFETVAQEKKTQYTCPQRNSALTRTTFLSSPSPPGAVGSRAAVVRSRLA